MQRETQHACEQKNWTHGYEERLLSELGSGGLTSSLLYFIAACMAAAAAAAADGGTLVCRE